MLFIERLNDGQVTLLEIIERSPMIDVALCSLSRGLIYMDKSRLLVD